MCKGSNCGKSECLRDFEQIWAFWGENRGFGKMSVRKKHFGEIWTVKVKTGLIQKMSVQKGIEVEIRSFGKSCGFWGNDCAKGATGVKTRLLLQNECAEGS